MENREQYGWSNFWWEEENDASKPRVLIVGDSIVLGYRPYVNSFLAGKASVDMYATSKSIDSPALLKELKYMLGEFKYDVIHFNNGLHGFHVSKEDYKLHFQEIIAIMNEIQPDAKLVLVTSTSVLKNGSIKEIEEVENNIVICRNEIVSCIAESRQVVLNDLYSAMCEKSKFRLTDKYHFNEDGKQEQARIVSKIISKLLENIY